MHQQSLHGISPEWLYESDCQNTIRYILGVKGENPLFCLGINPSTAIPNDLDNTLKSVARLAAANGFDGWIMLNVYPQRATNPDRLHQEIKHHIHRENLARIDAILSTYKTPFIWAAWGTLITKREYLRHCLTDIYGVAGKHNCKWVMIGNPSTEGHPHHPLYLGKKERHKEFDMTRYISKLTDFNRNTKITA